MAAHLLLRRGVASAAKAIPKHEHKHKASPLPLRGPPQAAPPLPSTGSPPALQLDDTKASPPPPPKPDIFTKSFAQPSTSNHAQVFQASSTTSVPRACSSTTPCKCDICIKVARRPFCQSCQFRPTAHQAAKLIPVDASNNNGVIQYKITSLCQPCWEQGQQGLSGRERFAVNVKERRERVAQAKKQARDAREEEVRKLVVRIGSMPPGGERVPLGVAIHKFRATAREGQSRNSMKWNRRTLVENLTEALQIAKVKGVYSCDKARLEAFDFKLWFGMGRHDMFPIKAYFQPEMSKPDISEPEISEPEISEPEISEPEISVPETSEPETSEPETSEPETSEPETSEPETSESTT